MLFVRLRMYRKTPFRTMSVSRMRRRFYYRLKFIKKLSKRTNGLRASSGSLRCDQLVYKGTFQFGDPTYPNLYLQLKDRIPRIRIRKEDATKKILLLENLERLTPESYKTMTTSSIQQQPDTTHVSRLRRGQRRIIYGVSGISFLLLGALSVVQLCSRIHRAVSKQQRQSGNRYMKQR